MKLRLIRKNKAWARVERRFWSSGKLLDEVGADALERLVLLVEGFHFIVRIQKKVGRKPAVVAVDLELVDGFFDEAHRRALAGENKPGFFGAVQALDFRVAEF